MPQTWTTFAVIVVGAALAGFAQGISGFAFSMIALSVWAWALAPEVAAPLAVFGALSGQLLSFAQLRGGYEMRRILPLVVGGLIGVPVGVFILHNVDPTKFRLAIGTMLTLYSAYGLLGRSDLRVAAGGRLLDAFIGLIGGVLGGLGGMSGAVPAAWTQLRGWKRDLRRATMQVYNIAMHVFTLTVYSRAGALDATALKLFALVAPAALIPAFFGARVYRGFSEVTFHRVVLTLLLMSGLAMLYGSIRALTGRG